jgi:hypothetical protein
MDDRRNNGRGAWMASERRAGCQYQNESHTVYDAAGRVIETRRHTRDQHGTLLWSVSRTVYDAAGRAVYSTGPFLMTTDATPVMVSSTVNPKSKT